MSDELPEPIVEKPDETPVMTEPVLDPGDKKKKKKDSIANIKHKKKPNVIKPICYGAPANTCYSQVQTK